MEISKEQAQAYVAIMREASIPAPMHLMGSVVFPVVQAIEQIALGNLVFARPAPVEPVKDGSAAPSKEEKIAAKIVADAKKKGAL